ncbi:MAG: DnaD domain protein [Anaerovoracaceae bacterium]|jgi:DnaD/phage-associated family protein
MKFFREDKDTVYLYETGIENIFINEYMPLAPEGYVKVFLLASMYVGSGLETDEETLAETLAMTPEDVRKGLIYWEKQGLLRHTAEGVEFLSLREKLYGRPRSTRRAAEDAGTAASGEAAGDSARSAALLENEPLRRILEALQRTTGRLPGGTELNEVADWLELYRATEEVILGAIRYCGERGKTNIRYIGQVVKDWTGRGLATAEDVSRHLENVDQRHYIHRRVMKALGFTRNATEEEARIISTWVDELGCSMDEILDACSKTSGISNPNINYVNAILCSKKGVDKKSGKVSRAVVQQYYARLRRQAEEQRDARRREVMRRLPRLAELEEEMVDVSGRLSQVMIGGGADKLEQMHRMRRRLEELEREKERLLTEHDIPVDALDVHYRCPHCGDTGVLESGARCECWMTRSEEAAQWYAQQHEKARNGKRPEEKDGSRES